MGARAARTGREPVLRPFLSSLAVADFRRARPWSAARRSAVTLLVMAATWQLVGPAAATSAGMAALLIGFLDRQQTARATLRLMSVGTIAMAITHLVADNLAPWSFAVIAILVVIAFYEGISIAVHPDAPIIAHFCGTIAATAAIAPPRAGSATGSALAVLVAGAAQTATTWATSRLNPIVREYELVAHELDLISGSLMALADCDDPTHPDERAVAAVDAAARNMTAARRSLRRSDLDPRLVDIASLVLWSAEQVRLEAKALSLADASGGLPGDLDRQALSGQFRATGHTLATAAAAFRGSARAQADAVAELLAAQPDDWMPAGHLRPALADLVAGTVALCEERPIRVVTRGEELGWWARSRAAAAPGTLSFKLGLRISVAAAAAMGVATLMGLSHASWASNSVLSIFRPDGGATLSRIALRAIAVSGAAIVVVGVALASGHDNRWLLVAMAMAIMVSYWLGPINYGLFGFAVTVAVLMILAATGADPVEIALARWVETLVGCAVALVVAFLMPVWKIQSLPATIANLAEALAQWQREIAAALARPVSLPTAVREAGARVRDLVSDAVTTFGVARLEPHGSVPVGQLRLVFAQLRASAQATLAAEFQLRRGYSADPQAGMLAGQAAALSDAVCAVIRGASPTELPALLPGGATGGASAPSATATALAASGEHASVALALAVELPTTP